MGTLNSYWGTKISAREGHTNIIITPSVLPCIYYVFPINQIINTHKNTWMWGSELSLIVGRSELTPSTLGASFSPLHLNCIPCYVSQSPPHNLPSTYTCTQVVSINVWQRTNLIKSPSRPLYNTCLFQSTFNLYSHVHEIFHNSMRVVAQIAMFCYVLLQQNITWGVLISSHIAIYRNIGFTQRHVIILCLQGVIAEGLCASTRTKQWYEY